MNVLIARVRVVLPMLGVLLTLVGLFADVGWLALVGLVVLVVGLACYFVLGTVRTQPVQVQPPVTGRWVALNSPANRVPSHGLHAYGQTYALDLVHEPPDRPRPSFGSGPGFIEGMAREALGRSTPQRRTVRGDVAQMTPHPYGTRRWALRELLPGVLVSCLVPLAACGSTGPTGATPATRPGPAALESPSDSTSPPATLVGVTVVLDPGHNGANASHPAEINRPVPNGRGSTKACNTTGTSTDRGYPEHAFNWGVALLVRDALTARGVQVVLTRPDDDGVGPCVNDRAAIANRAGADAVVSIHADGAAPSGRGFHVIYSDPPLNASQGPPSVALAEALARALRGGGFSAADYIGSGGLDARSDLAGLNLAEIPAALVECANMRNPKESALVSTPDGRARYAAAIADGILAWLTSQ